MKFIKFLINSLLDAVFPNKCVGCGAIIDKDYGLCEYCNEYISKTVTDNRCRVCGCKKKDCQCRYRVFHFIACTAPFYNEDIARQVVYAFKFRKRQEFGDFLAQRMALSVKSDFHDVDFNALVYVPMPFKKELKRGYNQSRELAVRLSKILNIPLVENAIGCNEKRYSQHKVRAKHRFENVKGAFYPNLSLKGRQVLLVDDIKTTGATLDECAKSLLKAGAEEVYCVTALISKSKKKEG